MVICGLAPRRLQTAISAFLHKIKRTHSQHPSKRKFNYNLIRAGLFLGRQFRDEVDLNKVAKEGVTAVVTLNEEWELFVPSTKVKQTLPHRLMITTPDYQAPTLDDLKKAVAFIDSHIQSGKGHHDFFLITDSQWLVLSPFFFSLPVVYPYLSQ